jgi:DNA polymerase/3'-5' exonuclease PolX
MKVLRLLYEETKVDVYFAREDQQHVMRLFLTGNKYFNVSMRIRAKRMGFKLGNAHIYQKDKPLPVKSERDVFKLLQMPFVHPRYRSMWVV